MGRVVTRRAAGTNESAARAATAVVVQSRTHGQPRAAGGLAGARVPVKYSVIIVGVKEWARLRKNITRYDGPKGEGCLVRFKRRGRERWKWFFDSAHGGREGSGRAALVYWKRTVLKLPVALRVMRRDARNTTGVVGVHLDWRRDKRGRKYWSYRAGWPEVSGKTVRRRFSVRKYGKARARALAVKARREGLRQLKAAKRAELRHEVGSGRGRTS